MNRNIILISGGEAIAYRAVAQEGGVLRWMFESESGEAVEVSKPLSAALDRISLLEAEAPTLPLIDRIESVISDGHRAEALLQARGDSFATDEAFAAAFEKQDAATNTALEAFIPELKLLPQADNNVPFAKIKRDFDLRLINAPLPIAMLPTEADLGNGWAGERSTHLKLIETDLGDNYVLRNSRVTLIHESGMQIRTQWSNGEPPPKGSAVSALANVKRKLKKHPEIEPPNEDAVNAFDELVH